MIAASAVAAKALREYLLAYLPAQVAVVNLTRAASLTTPAAGSWTIPAAASLSLSLDNTTFTACALTAGSRSASQIATEVNTAMGVTVATALTDGRLKLTSTTTPTGPDTASIMSLASDSTGANLALGFDPGGDSCVRAPLVTPTSKGLCDGEPTGPMEPYAQGRMVVVIMDRSDVAVAAELRREERLATLNVRVYVPMIRQQYQTREEIQAACECILDVISSTTGRYLGRSADGDVGFVQCKSLKVSGSSWQAKGLNLLLDMAELVITARVFQRPVL